MINLETLQPLIQSIFRGSGGKALSKQQVLDQAGKTPEGQKAMPALRQVPDKPDYNESSLMDALKDVVQKGGVGGIAGKIRSKIGV